MKLLMNAAVLVPMLAGLLAAGQADAQTTIRFATTLPDNNAVVTQLLQPWADYVNANSKGELVIELVNGGTVANGANVLDRIADGVVDGGWVLPGYTGKPFPRTLIVGLPFVAKSAQEATAGLNALLDAGMLDSEYANVAVGSLAASSTNGLHTKQEAGPLQQVAGLKLRVADKAGAGIAAAVGASGISMPVTEAYQAISQGVVDGIITGWPGVFLFKLQDVVNHHLEVPLGQLPVSLLFNKDVWDGLSAEQQALLRRTDGDVSLAVHIGAWYDQSSERFKQTILKDGNHRLATLDDATYSAWEGAISGVVAGWVAETEGGQAVLDTFKKGVASVH